jgi:hypothetical protein
MKHRSWLLRLGLAAVVALGGTIGAAHADPTTIAVRKCIVYACSSASQLKNEARIAYGNLPFGSIVFVSSQQYPLSAFARICPGPRGGRDACLITAGDLGAVELDNEVYARAAAIEPIDIPADIARGASPAIWELVEGHVLATLVITGRNGINPWHNILNPLTWPWMEVVDERTDAVQRIYAKDRITLRFADGSTAQIEMLDAMAPSGHYFHFLPETIRLPNGEPLAELTPPLPATPTGLGIDLTPPWLNAVFGSLLPSGYCALLQSHCEFVAGGSQLDCYYRRQKFPCG